MSDTGSLKPLRSLRRKLLRPLAPIMIGAILFSLGLLYALMQRQQFDFLQSKADMLATTIADVAENVGHLNELQRIVAAVGAEPGIDMIVIAAGTGRQVVASTQMKWLNRPLEDLPRDAVGEDLELALETKKSKTRTHDGGRIFDKTIYVRLAMAELSTFTPSDAAIMIHLDESELLRAARPFYLSMATVWVTLIAIILLISLVLISRLVIHPLSSVRSQLSIATAGQGEISYDASSRDEITDLVATLNDTIRRRRVLDDQNARQQAEINRVLRQLQDIKDALDEHAILAITDKGGVITHVNRKFLEISKYSAEEVIGQTHQVINSGYHPPAFFQDLWRTISSGRTWHGEIRNRAKDGSIYWVGTTIVPVIGENGKPAQYIAIRYDITDRKLQQERIIQENLVLNALRDFQLNQLQYLDIHEPFRILCAALTGLLHCRGGIIAEVENGPEGKSMLKILTRAQAESREQQTGLLHDQHIRDVIEKRTPILFNEAANAGNPAESFLGLPILSGSELVAVMAFFGRPGGYGQAQVELLSPVVISLGAIFQAERARRQVRAQEKVIAQKENLLQEVHHRLKNNLQIVSSLLSMQLHEQQSEQAGGALRTAHSRITSIGLLHELIYKSHDLDSLNLADFVRDLSLRLNKTFARTAHEIVFTVDIDKTIHIPQEKAGALALIINELITNSIKHAFPAGRAGSVKITGRYGTAPESVVVEMIDDGVGFDDKAPSKGPPGLGSRIIERLTSQISGTIEKAPALTGTHWILRFTA